MDKDAARKRAEANIASAPVRDACWVLHCGDPTDKRYHRSRNGQRSTLPTGGIPICDRCKRKLEKQGWALEEAKQQ